MTIIWLHTKRSFPTDLPPGKLRYVDSADFYMGDYYFNQADYGVNIPYNESDLDEMLPDRTISGIVKANTLLKKSLRGVVSIVSKSYNIDNISSIRLKLSEGKPNLPQSYELKYMNKEVEDSFLHVRDKFRKIDAEIYAEFDPSHNFLS